MKALIITSSDVFPIFLFLIFFSIIFLFFSIHYLYIMFRRLFVIYALRKC